MKKLLITVELRKEVKLGILDTGSENPGSVRTEVESQRLEPESITQVPPLQCPGRSSLGC